jgi:phthalate 4,5-cis-dihydrodiol dehydrogenase
MNPRRLKLGIAGLGRAFTLMLPTLANDPRLKLVGATDPQALACAQFERDFGVACDPSFEALCQNPQVEAIYIATPHALHADHVERAAAHGKHVMVEKPMALTLEDCTRMIDATTRAGVVLMVGHSHSFNAPILKTYELIQSGKFGAVRMIHALNYTDFLYRPRRPEELNTQAGGGVVFSQAAHQIDIVRLLGGGLVSTVMAHTGAWDPQRPTEGAYSALLGFSQGTFASLTYNGYGHFDSDAWMDGIGELGQPKDPSLHGAARQRLMSTHNASEEAELKAARNYGAAQWSGSKSMPSGLKHQHFGPLIVSCDGADLRPTAQGVWIDGDVDVSFEAIPSPALPRQEVIDEFYNAIIHDRPVLHSGAWARATTSVSLAVLASSQSGQIQQPTHQVRPEH